jgi:hypothetical protein
VTAELKTRLIGAHFAAPLHVVPALIAIHAGRQRPRIGMLEPLAPLPSEAIARAGAGAGRDVDRGVIDVAAVVERRIPAVRPVTGETVLAEQQRGVVELVGHVVVAAAHVEGRPVRHHPHRVARGAHAVAIAAAQRVEAGLGRVLLKQVGLELPVAGEHLEAVAEVDVDALREIPVVDDIADRPLQVVDIARKIRQWNRRQHPRGDRIDHALRNDVAGELRPDDAVGDRVDRRGERIEDVADAAGGHRLTEVAAALQFGRHGAHDRHRPLVVPLFERRERKNLVALDRAAERAAGHLQLGAAQAPVTLACGAPHRGVGDRVQAGIAPEVVTGSVALIGARLHVQADDAAQAVAVLGVDAVFRDGDLLDRVNRRRIGRLEAGAQRDAVEQHVVAAPGAAAGVEVVGISVVIRPVFMFGGARGVEHGRVEVGEVVGVSAADRYLIDQLALERQLVAAGIELHRRGSGLDDHRFLDAADLQLQIGGDVTALRHAHVLLLGGLEAL